MGEIAQRAGKAHEYLLLLHGTHEKSGRYDGADDEYRKAVMTTLATLGDFAEKIGQAEDSREYTEAGLAARRRTLREPVVTHAERLDQRAQALERLQAKSSEDAWAPESAPPKDMFEAVMITDSRRQLEALPELHRTAYLKEATPRGRWARRAAFSGISLTPLVSSEEAKHIREHVVRQATDLSGPALMATELRGLARQAREAVSLDDAAIRR